ncbi:Hsp20/alpha crystallin family protein [Desulforhopalus vacuolatus]|uniref:Hsp20/alpha crystallin family protein n=1 Tax=Desulforhopalus vacuolatus TaxID=40414 RepID=UPI001963B7AF|nr:Hsp20/alpha crystallin family protein [Desulforhopalus vacuolatus]MBM9520268.1 Hsp20/alpha crystallin family protein [Desulforhopalus vacuolatus]
MVKDDKEKKGRSGGFEGVLGGITDILEKLGDLAEKGEQLSRSGTFQGKDKDLKGVYGFSIKTGLGGKDKDNEIKVEPFGNIRRDEKTGDSVVHEIQEPLVDIFEEKDHTLVVAEMPGIGVKDVQIDIKDDLLTIYAEKGEKKYSKEILLPRMYQKEKMQVSCNNGILEIKCIP